MAQRRMFSDKIVDTDAFLDMGIGSQLLYFHLAMRADDDGFVSNPKKIMRMIGAQEDDYKVLIAKRFVIQFESGVCVIKHWLIHNLIRGDRYTETQYIKEKGQLVVDKKTKKYSLNLEMATNGIPNGNQMAPQVRIGKVSLVKDNKDTVAALPIWLNERAWNAWIQYRKEKKKSLTPTTVRLQLRFLEENKQNHAEIIKRSITNGWTGLFPLEEKKNFNKTRESVSDETPISNDRMREIHEQKKLLTNNFKM